MNNLLLLLAVFAVFFAVALPTVLTDFIRRNPYSSQMKTNEVKKKNVELK